YCGVQVLSPKLLADMDSEPFSCNRLWDNAIAARSLFGLVLAGEWLHIGTPEQLAAANKVIGED
ncbi:MAG: nucleotidyltransferase family protein, partial [Parvibaculales bacterium]